jgi:hypothetical protein
MERGFEIVIGATAGEPDDAKVSRPVRRGAVGKGPFQGHLAGCLPYYAPLEAAIGLVQEDPSLQEGDILILTDGAFGAPPAGFLESLTEARDDPGLKLAVVVIGGHPGQAGFADKVILVSDLFEERERLGEAIGALI